VNTRRRKPAARPGSPRKPAAGRDFWFGPQDSDGDADAVAPVRPSHDPTAMIRSLGPPPLAGRDGIAEHYFEAVYAKAAGAALALAAASDLLAVDDEEAAAAE
jgi:hypothetical protein